jgi:hypothetical protein
MNYKGCYHLGVRTNLVLPSKAGGKADVFRIVIDDNGEEKYLDLCCHPIYTDSIKKAFTRLLGAITLPSAPINTFKEPEAVSEPEVENPQQG